MTKVKIYSTPTCPFCKRAKEFFKKQKIEYEDVNVAENEKARNEMVEKSGQMGVPVIEVGDKIIVGFDEQGLKRTLKNSDFTHINLFSVKNHDHFKVSSELCQ